MDGFQCGDQIDISFLFIDPTDWGSVDKKNVVWYELNYKQRLYKRDPVEVSTSV